jgi:brefeldin A-resistance guanine nucleotide exchange factor 1
LLSVAADWSAVQPLEFLAPFLKLVREPEVSGPITGVALTALWRLLSSGVLGELPALHQQQQQHVK